jgi:hypothetical protein
MLRNVGGSLAVISPMPRWLQANRQASSRWASMYSKEYLQQEWVTSFE